MNSTTFPVSVLGLGRMGTAIARRLTDLGFPVTAWSRRPARIDGVRIATSPAGAVADARVVLLALYDAAACRQVLDRCGELPAVLNLATVGPAEAVELAARSVHCPVLGSVPAVATGSLTLLYGGAAPAPAEAAVLDALGTVVGCGDAATAAALKLVANGVLADGVVALGRALGRARRLGLDPSRTLEVLARTALGGLVERKRARLLGADRSPAEFTAGALRKDAELLAAADPASAALPSLLAAANADADADVAAIATALTETAADPATAVAGTDADTAATGPADTDADTAATGLAGTGADTAATGPVGSGEDTADAGTAPPAGTAAGGRGGDPGAAAGTATARVDGTVVDPGAHLSLAPGVPVDGALLAPLAGYARGHATGDPAHFRAAFRPTAHVEGVRGGEFVSWDLERYCANFTGRPADDEPTRVRTVTALGSAGTVGHATMVLRHGPDTFTDVFVLVREHGEWRIANKVYHRAAT